MTCARCGSGGWLHEWKAAPCANGRQEIAYWLCNECDILKNAELLYLQRVEDAEAKLEAYAATVRARSAPAEQAKADPARTVAETLIVKIDGQALKEQIDLSVADLLAHVCAVNTVVSTLSQRVTLLEESLGPLLRGE